MFSKTIVDSDDFLDMPVSARLLYYDLGMRADDDGFVNPKRVIRLTGSADDDLKILLAKKYVLYFEDKILVIRDWKVNNFIRPDRYTPTIYKEYLKKLEVIDTKQYRLPSGIPDDIPKGDRGKDRLGKDRKGKVTIVGKADEEFNLLEENKKLLSDPKRHIQIIGIWLKAKGPKIENKKQLQSFIKRNLRSAQLLEGYKNNRIIEVIQYLKENADFKFTLETVSKFVDEDLNKLNSNKILEI